jgi:hypothetical protein
MAAFRRRTVFAAPLIVIAGCGGKDAPNDPKRATKIDAPSWSVYERDGSCRAGVILDCERCNPPAPRDIECPVGVSETVSVVVVEKPDHTCAILPSGCASLSCATQATPCPTPYGPPPANLLEAWTIQRGSQSHEQCEAFNDLACQVPAGKTAPPCNPPPPMKVECPASFVDQLRIGKLADGSCVIAPAPCHDTSCVKEAIECPKAIN